MSYLDVSRTYLEHGKDLLEREDYRQASEKLWGAAAVTVKAVAEKRGWEHDGHRLLYQVIRRLSDETGDLELSLLFRAAGQLHINFYEGWLPPDDVEQASDEVEQLLRKLEATLDA